MLKKLKSLFIEEDDPKPENETGKSAQSDSSAASKNTSSSSTIQTPQSTPRVPGQVKSKFMNILLGALEKNNLEGIDYLEYKQSLKSLEKMPMDEPTRYKSAFAMAQAMGATPEHLIQTADHYLKVLLQEEQKFGHALDNQRLKQIDAKQQKINQLKETMQQKAEQIKKLSAEIEKHQQQSAKLEDELTDAATKVEVTKSDFEASYASLVSKISQDVEKMKSYLK